MNAKVVIRILFLFYRLQSVEPLFFLPVFFVYFILLYAAALVLHEDSHCDFKGVFQYHIDLVDGYLGLYLKTEPLWFAKVTLQFCTSLNTPFRFIV